MIRGQVIRSLLVGLALAACAAAATTTPAQAGILSPDDATELAQSLADAQADQDVCYGWVVDNNFDGTPDAGSSTGGPGAPLAASGRRCARGTVVLEGSIYYSCDSCEDEDSASVSIHASGMANPPTVADLEAIGLSADALTGDNDDTTLVNMVEALPLLVADRGNAPYVAYEAAPATAVPTTDHATSKPGSDFLRDTWIWLVLCGGLIVASPAFYLYKRAQDKPAPPPKWILTSTPPPPPPPPPPST